MMVNVTLERISTGGRRDRHRVLDGHIVVESSRDHVALTLALECPGAGAGGLAIGPMSGRKE